MSCFGEWTFLLGVDSRSDPARVCQRRGLFLLDLIKPNILCVESWAESQFEGNLWVIMFY